MADENILGETNLQCPNCNITVEVLNNDVKFSMELHKQSHKPLEDISKDLEIMLRKTYFDLSTNSDKNLSDVCVVCNEKVIILNNDVRFSLQIHAQNHKTLNPDKNVKQSNDLSFDEKYFSSNSKREFVNQETNHASTKGFENVHNKLLKTNLHEKSASKAHQTLSTPCQFPKNSPKLSHLLLSLSQQFSDIKCHYIVEIKKKGIMCLLCCCNLWSISFIKDHLLGKAHKNNENGENPLKRGIRIDIKGELMCTFCECRLTHGEKNLKQHIKGHAHKQKEKLFPRKLRI